MEGGKFFFKESYTNKILVFFTRLLKETMLDSKKQLETSLRNGKKINYSKSRMLQWKNFIKMAISYLSPNLTAVTHMRRKNSKI